MIGYTRKVGLRKPVIDLTCAECWVRNETCTHPELARAEIEARRRHKAHGNQPDPLCPCNWPGEPGERKVRPSDGLVETIQQAMPTPADPRAEYEANWESAWLEERERRRAALEAAKRRVASIPADHRRYLEGEFLRAEHKAAAIVAHGRTPCPHCPCTYTTECCYCDGSRTPLEDS